MLGHSQTCVLVLLISSCFLWFALGCAQSLCVVLCLELPTVVLFYEFGCGTQAPSTYRRGPLCYGVGARTSLVFLVALFVLGRALPLCFALCVVLCVVVLLVVVFMCVFVGLLLVVPLARS